MSVDLQNCLRFGSGWIGSCLSQIFVGRVGWVCWILGCIGLGQEIWTHVRVHLWVAGLSWACT